MCGIYGASSYSRFKQLHELNVTRGNFATGHLFATYTGEYEIEKFPGENDYDEYPTMEQVGHYNMYMGHTQSPTGSVRDFRFDTSHPFETRNWIVAHNGVLNNHQSLADEFLKGYKCEVDSMVIPEFMEYLIRNKPTKDNVELMDNVVKSVLDRLSGTYALFIYNKTNNLIYIARSGSTLFYSPDSFEFSSVKIDQIESVPEGVLYRYNDRKFIEISQLQINSSFIIF